METTEQRDLTVTVESGQWLQVRTPHGIINIIVGEHASAVQSSAGSVYSVSHDDRLITFRMRSKE